MRRQSLIENIFSQHSYKVMTYSTMTYKKSLKLKVYPYPYFNIMHEVCIYVYLPSHIHCIMHSTNVVFSKTPSVQVQT